MKLSSESFFFLFFSLFFFYYWERKKEKKKYFPCSWPPAALPNSVHKKMKEFFSFFIFFFSFFFLKWKRKKRESKELCSTYDGTRPFLPRRVVVSRPLTFVQWPAADLLVARLLYRWVGQPSNRPTDRPSGVFCYADGIPPSTAGNPKRERTTTTTKERRRRRIVVSSSSSFHFLFVGRASYVAGRRPNLQSVPNRSLTLRAPTLHWNTQAVNKQEGRKT